MSLSAVKNDMNEGLNDLTTEEGGKKQSIFDRFDRLAEDILANGDDIMTRRLSGEKVDKEETENQMELMKNLKILGQTIELLKKHGRVPNEERPPDTFDDMQKILDRVKKKKSSIANINQKIS